MIYLLHHKRQIVCVGDVTFSMLVHNTLLYETAFLWVLHRRVYEVSSLLKVYYVLALIYVCLLQR